MRNLKLKLKFTLSNCWTMNTKNFFLYWCTCSIADSHNASCVVFMIKFCHKVPLLQDNIPNKTAVSCRSQVRRCVWSNMQNMIIQTYTCAVFELVSHGIWAEGVPETLSWLWYLFGWKGAGVKMHHEHIFQYKWYCL